MNHDHLEAMADTIESAAGVDVDLAITALTALRTALPHASSDLRAGVVDLADMAVHLVSRALPNWSIALEATAQERDGRWTCTLRPSGARDDEEVIGIGRAPTPALAVIVAFLRVAIIRDKGYH